MDSNQQQSIEIRTPAEAGAPRRVLAVADWSLDPHVVVASLSAHDQGRRTVYGLLVPASLHGVDWAGEPHASRPCAKRQLRDLERLCRNAGIPVVATRIGEPEAASAIDDVFYDWPADEVLLFAPRRRVKVPNPFGLARRVQRATRVPVTRIPVSRPRAKARRSRSAPHCRAYGPSSAGAR